MLIQKSHGPIKNGYIHSSAYIILFFFLFPLPLHLSKMLLQPKNDQHDKTTSKIQDKIKQLKRNLVFKPFPLASH